MNVALMLIYIHSSHIFHTLVLIYVHNSHIFHISLLQQVIYLGRKKTLYISFYSETDLADGNKAQSSFSSVRLCTNQMLRHVRASYHKNNVVYLGRV